ncbi:hypothetical protein GCM10008018_16870 [Paenibacillus marchantiophytorum]|uniref:Uncharacterized protein n=1 Tax=Paenibacillus marchantiophytorum TaxID=1619310 RepID=A0ABQ2BUF9_9BACL|nr:endospore germination permease [Paenibacillus marchantiophytorum]GGI46393.1 hypothetical protein GCM10008018_16870 [Paenibacillus marchantiophytorum]
MFQNKEKISGNQALMLILAGGVGNIFIVLSVPAIKDAGRDGWISVLLAYGIAALLGLTLIQLGKRFPDKTFVQYLPIVLGNIPGKIAGLFYIIAFWVMTALILRETLELMKFFLPETPSIYISVFICILIVYAMKKGFEVFSRTAEFFSITMIALIVLLLLFIMSNLKWTNLAPVMENGVMPVFKGLRFQYPFAAETILFMAMAIWLPCLNDRKKAAKNLEDSKLYL